MESLQRKMGSRLSVHSDLKMSKGFDHRVKMKPPPLPFSVLNITKMLVGLNDSASLTDEADFQSRIQSHRIRLSFDVGNLSQDGWDNVWLGINFFLYVYRFKKLKT